MLRFATGFTAIAAILAPFAFRLIDTRLSGAAELAFFILLGFALFCVPVGLLERDWLEPR